MSAVAIRRASPGGPKAASSSRPSDDLPGERPCAARPTGRRGPSDAFDHVESPSRDDVALQRLKPGSVALQVRRPGEAGRNGDGLGQARHRCATAAGGPAVELSSAPSTSR